MGVYFLAQPVNVTKMIFRQLRDYQKTQNIPLTSVYFVIIRNYTLMFIIVNALFNERYENYNSWFDYCV